VGGGHSHVVPRQLADAPAALFAGQIARDVLLRVDELPDAGSSGAVDVLRAVLGGKGANQAVAFAQLGGAPTLLGVVGDDEVGVELLRQAASDGIDVEPVVRRAGAPSATIVEILQNDGCWRYLEHIPDEMLLRSSDVERVESSFATARAVVLQLQQPPEPLLVAARIGRRRGATVLLDGAPPARLRDELLAVCDVLRADTHEASLLAGVEVDDARTALRAARDLSREGPAIVMVGAGDDGDAVHWSDGDAVFAHEPTQVVDTTGAGDAMTAALALELIRGASPASAAACAVAAAGRAVGYAGGRPRLRGWRPNSDQEGAGAR